MLCRRYIIDCYGPFAANRNDSSILSYIIETDKDLNTILIPEKTLMLLDRGKNMRIREILFYKPKRLS